MTKQAASTEVVADGDGAETQVVPGGWKRAAFGLVVGLVAGAITVLALPSTTTSTTQKRSAVARPDRDASPEPRSLPDAADQGASPEIR